MLRIAIKSSLFYLLVTVGVFGVVVVVVAPLFLVVVVVFTFPLLVLFYFIFFWWGLSAGMDDTTEEQQQRWMPESIFVFAGEGQEPIDIATYLIDDQDIFAALRNTKPRLEFPADLYPPVWSSRKVIESAVKNAVSEADNINLTVLRTMPKTDGVHPSTTLACDMARTYRVPKNANDIQANVYDSNREDLQRIDKLGVRLDHFVNKSQGNRKEGYDQPRRTYTEKPSPDQECPFRIRLMLDPGICWYLKPWSGCRCHLYHTKLPTSEKRRRMDTCTDKERSDAAIYAQQGSAGVAANIVREQTGNHFSHSQMRHNKINVELDSGQVPLPDPGELPGGGSSAEQCIRFLEKDGEKSHIALYHSVTDTVLATIRGENKSKEKTKKKTAETIW
jgi:hypothetical protein